MPQGGVQGGPRVHVAEGRLRELLTPRGARPAPATPPPRAARAPYYAYAPRRAAAARGIVTVNAVPSPADERTSIVPPCASTICCTM